MTQNARIPVGGNSPHFSFLVPNPRRLAMLLTALLLCLNAGAYKVRMTVDNPGNAAVRNKPCVVRLSELPSFSLSGGQTLGVFVNGRQIASQLDDLDRDGQPDELTFLIDLPAGGHRDVTIKSIRRKRLRAAVPAVYADLIYKPDKRTLHYVQEMSTTLDTLYNYMHHHGVAFESELMAYRLYFDKKHTVDVYGKKTPRLELQESGWYPDDEQLARGFGDDVLRVSGSVGVGSLKPWNGSKAVHFTDVERRTQRILAAGPLRTVCEIEIEGWQYEGKQINLSVRYILYAHHRDCQVEVRADQDIDRLVTGVQKVGGERCELLREPTLVGSWGIDWPVNDTVKYARETVGLGVACRAADVVMPCEDKQNNLLMLRYRRGTVLRYHLTVVSLKQTDCPIRTAADFFAYLRRWQEEL